MKNLYFIFIILFSGGSISFFKSFEGLIILFVVGFLLFGKTLENPSKKLLIALAVWMSYFIISTVLVKSFHPFFMGTYIAKITIAWWIITYFKKDVLFKYENIIYTFSIISLFFYTWELIHSDSVYSLISLLDLSQNSNPNTNYASIVIYSIGGHVNHLYFPRNSGFTWEPGPFASFISIAIYFNLIRNKLKFKDKKILIIFVLTIITTQSTTGYLLLLLLIVWLAWSKSRNKISRIFALTLSIIVVFIIFINTPILQNKIRSEAQQDIHALIETSRKHDRRYGPGRFASFQLALIDFKRHPIAGVGGNIDLKYATQQGADVHAVNGIGNIMTRYGSIGLILLFYVLLKTGRWFSNQYQYKGTFIFPTLLLIIGFSFSIIQSPIIIIFLFLSIFSSNKLLKYA